MDLLDNSTDDSFVLNDEAYENILGSFRHHQISSAELFLSSSAAISRKLNKTEREVNQFIEKYQEEAREKVLSSLHVPSDLGCDENELENTADTPAYFTVGDETIDATLNGGIPKGYLIEVSGKSASGKTNFLLTLSITIQLPLEFGGLGPSIFSNNADICSDIKTLYIPTESPLATQRLTQIVENFTELLRTNGISTDNQQYFPKLDNVLTTSNAMTNLEEQDHILKYQLPVILSRDPNIKLLIIDSLTHHPRAELLWSKQAEYVRSVCIYLKKIAKKFDITVIIANQVTDKPVSGLYLGDNDIMWKLNTEYQLAWMAGWDDIGIIYRQLMRREGVIDEAGKSFERLDYLDEIQTGSHYNALKDEENNEIDESTNAESFIGENIKSKRDIRNILKSEKKRLFDSTYKVKVSGIGTRPALGLTLLEYIDMRIVLSKEYVPILNENLIDEFSVELGIETTNFEGTSTTNQESNTTTNLFINNNDNSFPLETSTQDVDDKKINQQQIVTALANNSYLQNYNFESFRSLKCVFGPLIPAGETRRAEFEIWKGGIRKYNR